MTAGTSVGIVCSSRELFGADRSAVRLARVMQRAGYTTTLLLPQSRPELGLSELSLSQGIPVAEIPVAVASSGGLEGLRGALPLPRARAQFDTLIYNSTAVLAAAVRGRRRICVVREWLLPQDPRHRAIAAVVRRRSDAVVAIGEGVADQWRAVAGPTAPVTVIPNWLDDGHLAATNPEAGEGVLCLGRFNDWKGQQDLADVYERLSLARTLPPLVFVGAEEAGPRAALADAIRARGDASGLWRVEAAVPDPRDFLRRAAAVVVPSKRPEPFGMVMLEALAEGARVIAYEGGGPTELHARFGNAVLLAERRVDALAATLERWVADGARGLDGAEVQTARRVLERDYSESRAVTDWVTLLDRTDTVRHSQRGHG